MLVSKRSICTRSLRLIGAVGAGQTPDADDMADAATLLDEMMDGWKIDRLAILVVEEATFSLVVGQQRYTIGPGGNFDRQRPSWIDDASIISNQSSLPLELGMDVLTTNQWQGIPTKTIRSALPRKLYYNYNYPDSGANAGLGDIYIYPVPSVSNLQVKLYLPTALDEFADLDTSYNMPPGYARALRYNLGVELCPDHGIAVPPDVFNKASEFLNDIRGANVHPDLVAVDEAITRRKGGGGGYFNYYTGEGG